MKCGKLFEEIENSNNKYLDILEDVCNIESPTEYKKGVDSVGEYFLNLAKSHGWQTEVFCQEISGNAVCITLNSDAEGAPVCVSGHIDTVHPVGAFGIPAVKRDSKNMYGPGVMDCKGGVVAAFMAMDALEKCGFKKRPVKLILQPDEENGSVTSGKATVKFMCEKAKDAQIFLNLEGYKKGTAVICRKGIIRYRFTVHGKALHSARCTEASNAVAEAAYKIIKLEEMKDAEGLTCNCGVISGGSAANTVAEKCVFYADIRFSNDDELEKAKQAVTLIAASSTVQGCTCTLEEISYRPAMPECERNLTLLQRMNEIYKENGMPELVGRKCLSGSDAAYITQCNISCIDNLGTEGSNIHSVNEYIELKSLCDAAKRIAAVIYCI